MNTLTIKNNFCNGHQYEMQKSWDGGGNNVYNMKCKKAGMEEGIMPIKSF